MGFLLSLLIGFIPTTIFACIIYWLDRYEKEPKKLIYGAFGWGALIAAGGAFILNSEIGWSIFSITGSNKFAEISTGSIVAPIVEESLKAMSVILVFLFFFKEFDSILDGIVYAAVTALGFAATENVHYIYTYGFLQNGYSGLFSMAFIRVFLVGWQHPFYTSFFGIGLASARLEKKPTLKIIYIASGYFLAISVHALHNTIPEIFPSDSSLIIETIYDWSGWIFMLVFTLFMVNREKKLIQRELAEEVNTGLIDLEQYRISYSEFDRMRLAISSFGTTRYKKTRLFYQLCAELAHKKNQLNRMGIEQNNDQIITDLRLKLGGLSKELAL